MNHGSDRSRRREQFDFNSKLPLGELGQKCINGELSFDEAVMQFQKDIIFKMLARCCDNRKAAAHALGLQRSTLMMALARFAKMPVHSPKSHQHVSAHEPAPDSEEGLQEILCRVSPSANWTEYGTQFQATQRSLSCYLKNTSES
jgi:hypothetical protein